MRYGYIRVSSKDQNIDRQVLAINESGVDRLYIDKQSGKDFQRPEYRKLCRKLMQGDLVIIKSIDRLGRNYTEIQEQWKHITTDKQADICVLDMPLLDTRRDKDLIGTFISDLVLQILSFVAQTERDFIKERQREGILAAKARGVKFGRPRTIQKPAMFEYFCDQWRSGRITASEAARRLGLNRSSFMWLVKRGD